MAAEPERFAALFNKPSVDAMHALSPREFERFVAYVLRRAGYEVKEVGPHWLRGVDLEMRLPGKAHIFGGVECKRFQPDQLVTAPVVKGVRGAPAVSKPRAKPFVVTTSDFNDAAHKMALAEGKRAYLLNGRQLVRYITYIQRSRYDDDDVITSLSPEFFAGRDNKREPDGGAKVLAVANNKGGVGKTTTAYYLGVELARRGKRVLLIDLDGQSDLTDLGSRIVYHPYEKGRRSSVARVIFINGADNGNELRLDYNPTNYGPTAYPPNAVAPLWA